MMQKSGEKTAAIVGGGPAGLMAAESLARAGVKVTVYDRMPSLARKFLMAGRGGLNITHSEAYEKLLTRYGEELAHLRPALDAFRPDDLRAWCHDLGEETFIGSSGRIFPKSLKASPLLRAWLRRLDGLGVQVKLRHTFRGWDRSGGLVLETAAGARIIARPDVIILAMGGASWPRLGSDGRWAHALHEEGIDIAPLRASNCGFEVEWSAHVREQFAGAPLKNVALSFACDRVRGECVIAEYGMEGGAIYALSSRLRKAIEEQGSATLHLDLRPDNDAPALTRKLDTPRGKASISNHLRKRAGLSSAEVALLRETHAPFDDAARLAAHIKAVPLKLLRPRPLARAISTAGGVRFAELDAHLMLKKRPGIFCAGEMLDWEAPTGGYLLQACFATGKAAGEGALAWLAK